MKSKLILLILVISICISLEHVVETYSNGMPKVVKTYNGYGKLQLNKEIGYYSDGDQKYQKTYYNGELQNTQRWDSEGKKIIENKVSQGNIYNQKWSLDQKSGVIDKCAQDPNTSKEMCECMIGLLSAEFTYEEYVKYDTMSIDEIPKDVMERSRGLMEKMMNCSP